MLLSVLQLSGVVLHISGELIYGLKDGALTALRNCILIRVHSICCSVLHNCINVFGNLTKLFFSVISCITRYHRSIIYFIKTDCRGKRIVHILRITKAVPNYLHQSSEA